LIALAGKPLLSPPNPAYVVYFIMDLVQSWTPIFRIAHHKNLSMMCTHHGSGVPRIGQLTTDLWQPLDQYPCPHSYNLNEQSWMNSCAGWRNMTEGGFFGSVIKPCWLMTYVWGKLCGFSCYNIKCVVLIKAPISLMLQFISGMCDFWVFPLIISLGSWHICEVNFVVSSIKM
jgi:hypothetical protein